MGPSKGFLIGIGIIVVGGCIAMLVLYRMYARIPEVSWDGVEKMIREEFPKVGHITTSDLSKLQQEENSDNWPVIIDCRDKDEFEVSHLPLAVHAETVSEIEKVVEADRQIVVYCSVGYRSARLVSELQRAGITKVRNLSSQIQYRCVEINPNISNASHPLLPRHLVLKFEG